MPRLVLVLPVASAASAHVLPPDIQPGKHGPHYFQTPSQNIGCYLSNNSVRCDIRERTWSPPPKPKFCIKVGVDWGQGIGVGEKKAGIVCQNIDTRRGFFLSCQLPDLLMRRA